MSKPKKLCNAYNVFKDGKFLHFVFGGIIPFYRQSVVFMPVCSNSKLIKTDLFINVVYAKGGREHWIINDSMLFHSLPKNFEYFNKI